MALAPSDSQNAIDAAHELDLQAFDLSGDGLDLNTGKISY
jgi:hypothetical protein